MWTKRMLLSFFLIASVSTVSRSQDDEPTIQLLEETRTLIADGNYVGAAGVVNQALAEFTDDEGL